MVVYSPMGSFVPFSAVHPKMPLACDELSFQRCQTPK